MNMPMDPPTKRPIPFELTEPETDEFSDLDFALSSEWTANGFPMTHRELKELEEENI